jgi:mono/diheme cytochrome c family protein
MCSRSRLALLASALALATYTQVAVAQQHDAGMHKHPEAAKLKNPVKPDPKSVAVGKKLYGSQCATCHGADGKGDGKGGALLNPKPSDLTDATWKHGSSEGEIFTVIRDGADKSGMKPFGGRITTQEIWHLVNYLRTLGSQPTQSH